MEGVVREVNTNAPGRGLELVLANGFRQTAVLNLNIRSSCLATDKFLVL